MPRGGDIQSSYRKEWQVALLPHIKPQNLLKNGQSSLSIDGRRIGASDRIMARKTELWTESQESDSHLNSINKRPRGLWQSFPGLALSFLLKSL